VWTCPITGLKVPKTTTENLAWRAKLLASAEENQWVQRALYTACSQSILFWVNAFVFTYRLFRVDDNGKVRQCRSEESHVPFITWEIQDKHILDLKGSIEQGEDLLTDKSRDMGATWDHIVVFHHEWLFLDDRSFLEISRKEDCVDTLGRAGEAGSDPGTLFGKHDYINRWLPRWMIHPGAIDRKRMHMTNLLTRSRIDGESSNASAGSSDRRTAILLDEMAKMSEGESIKRSTKDVTATRFACSTPNGAGTSFSKWRKSGQVRVFVLPWWEHPEKGCGRYLDKDDSTGQSKIRSPWYDAQEKVRSPREMAIEIDMDHIGSGELFFEPQVVELHRRLFAKPERYRYDITFGPGVSDDSIRKAVGRKNREKVSACRKRNGSWKIWCPLVGGRLDQTKSYVMAMDISKGQGASNSTCSLFCEDTREKVGEYADATVPPYEFAKVMVASALWVGGARNGNLPLMIWEANGPGWDFGRIVVKTYLYPNFYRDVQSGSVTEKVSKRYGWHSTRDKKEEMLGILRRAYAHGHVVNHSDMALDEALEYVYYDGGGIGPASLQEESEQAQKTHGDRVISDGLGALVLSNSRAGRTSKSREEAYPPGSVGWRKRQALKRTRERKSRRGKMKFDFRWENSYAE